MTDKDRELYEATLRDIRGPIDLIKANFGEESQEFAAITRLVNIGLRRGEENARLRFALESSTKIMHQHCTTMQETAQIQDNQELLK